MNRKDYYKILKIDKNASGSDIKKVYRKLALEFHPDINTGKDAEEKFKEISEAYAVLSDSEKRLLYDRTGNIDFSKIFNRNTAFRGMSHRPFCKGRGIGRRCSMGRFNQQRFWSLKKEEHMDNGDYIFNLPLSFDEALNGIEKDIYLNRRHSIKHFRAIIPQGTKDGDLIQIDATNFNKSNENYYLRIRIVG